MNRLEMNQMPFKGDDSLNEDGIIRNYRQE